MTHKARHNSKWRFVYLFLLVGLMALTSLLGLDLLVSCLVQYFIENVDRSY
jgi:hypothetical protein